MSPPGSREGPGHLPLANPNRTVKEDGHALLGFVGVPSRTRDLRVARLHPPRRRDRNPGPTRVLRRLNPGPRGTRQKQEALVQSKGPPALGLERRLRGGTTRKGPKARPRFRHNNRLILGPASGAPRRRVVDDDFARGRLPTETPAQDSVGIDRAIFKKGQGSDSLLARKG